MKVVIIAAGMGTRLLYLTKDTPKCMVKVRGKPIIEHQLDVFHSLGINNISIIKGYLKEYINYPDTKSYYNEDYVNNNILASLFCAENELNDEVLVCYSDILFEREVVEKLMQSSGDINVVIDEDWKKSYVGRILHPESEAEKAVFINGKISHLGKHLSADLANGEFIGMFKLSQRGAHIFKSVYYDILQKCGAGQFQHAATVKRAYITDLFQELIERGFELNPVVINGGWKEIDTLEDLKKAGGFIMSPSIQPEKRRKLLKEFIAQNKLIRTVEVHNGISAIIANNAILQSSKISFDALWISSLTESAAKGQPDIEIAGLDSRLHTVNQVLEVTNKPLIIDADTGGDPNAFEYFIRKAEMLGVSAVIVEDKRYPKRNSLDGDSQQLLEDPVLFAHKIKRGKHALLTSEFLIIARIESLIAGKTVDDALERAKIYLEAGADGIMIHSKEKSPDLVLEFAKRYKQLTLEIGLWKPLVCVPTTYNRITEKELEQAGFTIIIHANHLLRAAIKSMQRVCESLLHHGRSYEAEQEYCSSVSEIFDLVGFSDIKNKEKHFNFQSMKNEVGKNGQ